MLITTICSLIVTVLYIVFLVVAITDGIEIFTWAVFRFILGIIGWSEFDSGLLLATKWVLRI